ncbi:MAG: hypothetical protein QME50_05880 [Candidatus Bathyarchaeota archaeon]|nr:hypothetical protein [Candidatus Bathyarchaeota archaeon]
MSSPAMAPPNLTPIQISSVTQEPERDKVEPYQEVTVRANVTDQIVGVGYVMLEYSVNGDSTWNSSNMIFNEALGLYEGVIPGQPENTFVKYYVHASDKINHHWVNEDNYGQYYVYTIIPELPSVAMLLLLLIFSSFVTIMVKRRSTKI